MKCSILSLATLIAVVLAYADPVPDPSPVQGAMPLPFALQERQEEQCFTYCPGENGAVSNIS